MKRTKGAVCAATMMVITLGGCGGGMQPVSSAAMALDPVLHGRQMVIQHDCGACHGGGTNPAAAGWLAGARNAEGFMPVGPFKTYPSNLTPDPTTGVGRYSERQIFNALRYGLRPSVTPDVEITSTTPGQGNFPAQPQYLAPSMPWAAWRHMSDQELWAIAAYLKRGVRPVVNNVVQSQSPPDFWASESTPEKYGPYPMPAYPAAQEIAAAPAMREQVLRGRFLTASHACAGCHGSKIDPNAPDYLGGITKVEQEWQIGPFKTRPRNLTPDNTTGMGRFSDRQIFNSLRYGLRPGETPDVEITSTVPGVGNFPLNPKYLAPPMPWPAWRHMSDADLWAIVAYLKSVKPVRNRVQDSEGPPDFWASEYTQEKLGPRPALPFPTANEIALR